MSDIIERSQTHATFVVERSYPVPVDAVWHALSDNAFRSTIAYTVVIHWRQANRYVKRAEQLINGRVMLSKTSTPGFRLTPVPQSHASFAPSASAR